MCGIVGLYSFAEAIDPDQLDRFTDTLTHRGPDARGTFIDKNLGLGHRRLAILDLNDAGKCPMTYVSPKGTIFLITYNGEVYNFLELRRELEQLGHVFRTDTDTEVVLASFSQWGEDCLLRFNGMWAFAIWDSNERSLFISRDRFGIKPICYAYYNNKFAFASELKAFLALHDFQPQLNERIVPQLIQNSYAFEGTNDETLMSGVKKLPGGHCLKLKSNGELQIRRWWNTADHIPKVTQNYAEQVEQFREIFLDAVRIRMRSDVAVGTCLSGGIDSSAVACAMAYNYTKSRKGLERCAGDWQQAFIATFPSSFIDEREYADQIVQHIGAKPHYWVFNDEEALSHVVDTVWALEDVYGGIGVPAWCLYKKLRNNNVFVSLDGHGGDELLCGYTWYLDWPMNKVNENLYRDFHTNLLPAILRNYDRCSMAHGIEVRMPLMDWRLVAFSFGLTAESKIGNGYTKRILRDAMKGIMPETIRNRRSKIGFNSPMIEWFNGGMAPMIRKIVDHPYWLDNPFWNGRGERQQILAKTDSNGWQRKDWGESLRVWTLMNVVLWHILFVEQPRVSLCEKRYR